MFSFKLFFLKYSFMYKGTYSVLLLTLVVLQIFFLNAIPLFFLQKFLMSQDICLASISLPTVLPRYSYLNLHILPIIFQRFFFFCNTNHSNSLSINNSLIGISERTLKQLYKLILILHYGCTQQIRLSLYISCAAKCQQLPILFPRMKTSDRR